MMMMIVNKWKKAVSYRLGWKWKGPPHTLQIVVAVGTAFIICSLILTELPRNLKKDEVLLSDPSSTTMKPDSCMQFIVSSTQSGVKPNLSCNCERGPQIAKVVRKLKCEIEPLDFGLVVPGRAWCNKHAIFPIGFRSWVRYLSVIDPTQRSHYVSEILDVGISVPLFRVTVGGCPTEVFMCVSAMNCWDMIHDKVTQKIVSEHRQGKLNLHPLQPRGSINGFDMFGFSTPFIVQELQLPKLPRIIDLKKLVILEKSGKTKVLLIHQKLISQSLQIKIIFDFLGNKIFTCNVR